MNASGADIAKEIRARVADLNMLIVQADRLDLITSLDILKGGNRAPQLSVLISQEV